MIDRNITDEYLDLVDLDTVDGFELVDIKPTDKQKFTQLING